MVKIIRSDKFFATHIIATVLAIYFQVPFLVFFKILSVELIASKFMQILFLDYYQILNTKDLPEKLRGQEYRTKALHTYFVFLAITAIVITYG